MSAINNPGGGVTKQGKITLFDRVCHAETPVPSPRLLAPSKFFLVTSAADEVAAPERALEAVTRSPTSIRQAGSPTTSSYPSACPSLSGGTVVPISHGGGRGNSRRPWDARLGLAGALNGEPTAAAAATTLLTGRHSLRVRPSCSPSLAASSRDVDVSSCWWNTNEPVRQRFDRRSLAPGEMEASEDYCTRVVIARELDPRTAHVLDGHVGGIPVRGGHGEFLRWCHGCSKELGQGKDIFMYRGEMAFCSHECRCLEMLLDEKSSDADCLRVFEALGKRS